MNQTTANWNSTRYVPQYQPETSKTLSQPKSLGGTPGAQGNVGTDCAKWIEQNQELYQSIMKGTSGLSQRDQAQFMDWYRYAYETAFGGSQWGDGMAQGGMGGMQPNPQSVPPGSKMGPLNNIVFNQEKGEFTYADGVAKPIDVLSDQFNLNLSVKAKVDIEKTTDTRIQPAATVYKVTIHDPASNPSDSVVFLSTDTKLDLKTLGGKGVTFHGGIENEKMADGSPRFTVGTFTATDATAAEGGQAEAMMDDKPMQGVADKTDPNTITYTPQYEGGTVDLYPTGGKNQTHVVNANANINCKPGDSANVQFSGSDVKITITHADGSTDTIHCKVGYMPTININKQFIRFNGKLATEAKAPEPFTSRVKVPSLLTGAPVQDPKFDGTIYADAQLSATALGSAVHVGGHTGK